MFKIGTKEFDKNKTYIMGILNVTPDSFSDGGRFVTMDKVLERAEEMVQEGTAIIDVGGESTRPGYTMISEDEEISRVVPAIEAIQARFDIPISIDTYKSRVAEAAICAGADMVNDIWGLAYDPKMKDIVKRYDVSCAITHNRKDTNYNDFMTDCLKDMKRLYDEALAAGIENDKIILDVGLGFAKSTEQNLMVMKHLDEFVKLGAPVLIGASKKSFIGNSLSLPVNERMEGTLATTAMACASGVTFVRVHDIKENARLINMYEKVYSVD